MLSQLSETIMPAAVVLWIAAFTTLLALVTYGIAKLPRAWNLFFFGAISILILAYLVATDFRTVEGFFGLIKFVTLCVSAFLIASLRFYDWWRKPWARLLFYLILVINILEAVAFEVLDLSVGGPERSQGGSVLNALAGIMLILTQALPRRVTVDDELTHHLRYDLGVLWILVYTLWDFTFVYGTNPPGRPTGEWAGLAVVHLMAPLCIMARNGTLYIQMRMYSLCILAGLALIVPFEPWLYRTPDWYHRPLADALAYISFGLATLLFLLQFRAGARSDVPANPVQVLARRASAAR